MNFLLDTNVIAELNKSGPNRQVVSWLTQNAERCVVSAIVVGELVYGAERIRKSNPVRAAALDDWREGILAVFADRMISIDREVGEEWGRLAARIATEPISANDALIAASALVHDLVVATRNVRHFERTGVRLVNPFEA